MDVRQCFEPSPKNGHGLGVPVPCCAWKCCSADLNSAARLLKTSVDAVVPIHGIITTAAERESCGLQRQPCKGKACSLHIDIGDRNASPMRWPQLLSVAGRIDRLFDSSQQHLMPATQCDTSSKHLLSSPLGLRIAAQGPATRGSRSGRSVLSSSSSSSMSWYSLSSGNRRHHHHREVVPAQENSSLAGGTSCIVCSSTAAYAAVQPQQQQQQQQQQDLQDRQ